jgi:hypothetical protein
MMKTIWKSFKNVLVRIPICPRKFQKEMRKTNNGLRIIMSFLRRGIVTCGQGTKQTKDSKNIDHVDIVKKNVKYVLTSLTMADKAPQTQESVLENHAAIMDNPSESVNTKQPDEEPAKKILKTGCKKHGN